MTDETRDPPPLPPIAIAQRDAATEAHIHRLEAELKSARSDRWALTAAGFIWGFFIAAIIEKALP
tara:strand:- start:641 stop:835 length:195 start_codon:yes stop_codon:yes gene_type:complete